MDLPLWIIPTKLFTEKHNGLASTKKKEVCRLEERKLTVEYWKQQSLLELKI